MPHRNMHQHGGGKSRSESSNASEKPEIKSEREQMSTEQPSYDSLDDSQSGGSLAKTEHRADTSRMSKKARALSSSSAERSEDLDSGPARGEAAGAHGMASETAAEQPSRGESWGIGDQSGGSLSDDSELPARGESTSARARDELTWAGFSRSEDAGSSSTRARASLRSSSAPRGESSGRAQEPSARGGSLEPDEHTSGSRSRRH